MGKISVLKSSIVRKAGFVFYIFNMVLFLAEVLSYKDAVYNDLLFGAIY